MTSANRAPCLLAALALLLAANRAEACGAWDLRDYDVGRDATFLVNYSSGFWPWNAWIHMYDPKKSPDVRLEGDDVVVGEQRYTVTIAEADDEKCPERSISVRITLGGRLVAESRGFDGAPFVFDCGGRSDKADDELRRVIAGYLIWREELLAEVAGQLPPEREDPRPTIDRLIKRLDSRNRSKVLVSALALGRVGPAAIPSLKGVVARDPRKPRDVLAIESALLALQHIGPEARPVIEPLADHRHRKIREAAARSLEWLDQARTAQPSSLPPGYGSPPRPPAEQCAGCRYLVVKYGEEADFDEALLCAHEPKTPVKPFNHRGALLRKSVEKCDPACCDHGSK